MAGIYIHIPFCKSHCTYCGFYSELLRGQGSDCFIDALVSELSFAGGPVPSRRLCPPPDTCRGRGPGGAWEGLSAKREGLRRAQVPGETLYIGGGTPSVLSLSQLGRIVDTVGSREFDEFTMEVNPDDILKGGPEYARGLRELGVNRISMGVQSLDDEVLHRMGRRHTADEARQAYATLRDAGFDNISIDFIFGFTPNWDAGTMLRDLQSLADLPEHISCYQLSIEPGSGLEKMVERGHYTMPDDEQCEKQYYDICALLRTLGYEHYEISNWARPGRRSRHNSAYWNHTPYLGFGPGAHSLIIQDGRMVRRWNNPDLQAYIKAAQSGDWDTVRGSETLTAEQVAEERIMLGLRTAEGVDGKRIPEDKWFISDSIIVDYI